MDAPSTRSCPQCGKMVAARLPRCPFCNAALDAVDVQATAPLAPPREKPAAAAVVMCPRCKLPYSFAKNPSGCPHCTKNPAFAALSSREIALAEKKAATAGATLVNANLVKIAGLVIAPLVFGAVVWWFLSTRDIPEIPTSDDKIFERMMPQGRQGEQGLLKVETPHGVFTVPGMATITFPRESRLGSPRTEEGCVLTPDDRISTLQHRKARAPDGSVAVTFRFVDMRGHPCSGGWISSAFLKPVEPFAGCPPQDGACADGAIPACAP